MAKKPKLYEYYDASDLIPLCGPKARVVCDEQWIISADKTKAFCLATVGDGASNFVHAGQFCWVAEKNYKISALPYREFIPEEVVGPDESAKEIGLFIRNTFAPKYQFVGHLTASYLQVQGESNERGEAYFSIVPSMPSKVWSQYGYQPGSLDHAMVDKTLQTFKSLKTADERFAALQRIVEYWHGPMTAADGMPDSELKGFAMPDPLRKWYQWAGYRWEVLTGQNELMQPAQLKSADSMIVFYVENEFCYEWGTLPEGDDPSVFGRMGQPAPWEREGVRLIEHMVLACLFEAVSSHAAYGASSAWIADEVIAEIAERVRPIELGPWRWLEGMRFYASKGAFMYCAPNGIVEGKKGCSVWIGAKSEQSLAFLKSYVNQEWDFIAF